MAGVELKPEERLRLRHIGASGSAMRRFSNAWRCLNR